MRKKNRRKEHEINNEEEKGDPPQQPQQQQQAFSIKVLLIFCPSTRENVWEKALNSAAALLFISRNKCAAAVNVDVDVILLP